MSGGSTLTMQVARILDGRDTRSAAGKLLQMARALQLEARLSKAQILQLYLERAPFGGMKQSGIGREKGRYGVEDYLEYKTIYLTYDAELR